MDDLHFDWKITQRLTQPEMNQRNFAILKERVAQIAHNDALTEGLTDEGSINKYVAQEVAMFVQANQPFSAQMTKVWHFEGHDGLVGVGGENQNSPFYLGKFLEYYGQGYGIAATLSGYDPRTGKEVQPKSVEVWGCAGDCIRVRNPFSALLLNPEDFVMLMGKNPMKIYHDKWRLISETPDVWNVQGEVEEGNNSPFTIDMALSKVHGGVPSSIKIIRSVGLGARWISEYQVKRWTQYQGEWLPAEVQYSYSQPSLVSYKRDWTLEASIPIKALNVWLPSGSDIADYRLLGKDLTANTVLNITDRQKRDLVTYQWRVVNHKLPSEEKLEGIRNTLHPGESTPDPNRTSSARTFSPPFFIGGILCLVGGVWMFKRRGVS